MTETVAAIEPTEAAEVDELISQDLLVEEVSIDGMCGVY
jgi:mycofactocin precursor